MENKNYNLFLKLDLSKYIGKWIAICEGKIICEGINMKKVFGEAKKTCPNKRPLIVKVPESETMIF